MKKYIISLSVFTILLSTSIGAQELFPELEGIKSNTDSTVQADEENAIADTDAAVSEEVTTSEPLEEPKVAAESDSEEENDEEDEDDNKKSQIILAIDNVDSTLTAIRSVSYCNMDFIVQNKTPKTIKSIAGTFSWQDHTEEFAFQDIAKNAGAATNYLLVGTVCEHLLEAPDLNITTCQIDGMSPKKCKTLIKFTPIGNDSEN